MTIRVLPPEVATKIAAGEVVERPASVVKELVENSLDAGATEVSIEVRGGGLELIRVVDNGSGIPSDQVTLALQRHATSKLSSADDLSAIATLGFRGEALPSIAAVSHLAILTRPPQEQQGAFLEMQGERVLRQESRGAPQGTAVTVRRLFANVPARLKFIKSRASEGGRVQQVAHQYMLAYPEVRFTLLVEDRPPQVSGGMGRVRDVLALLYGSETADAFLELPSAGDGLITIAGLISPPGITRSNRNAITLMVNRRWAQSRVLAFALEEAYRGFLQEQRHPMAVVTITLPYDEVDVNVHPAKSEVRFHEESRVFAALQRAVREALTKTSPVPTLGSRTVGPVSTTVSAISPSWSSPRLWSTPPTTEREGMPPAQAPLTPKEQLPALRVLGQFQETYVVAEGPDGMYLVDQHAAHERVTYERIKEEMATGGPSVQGLLEPTLVEVALALEETLRAHQDLLELYGFQVEPFGGGSYLVRGVPAPLSGASPGVSLVELLEELALGIDASDLEEHLVRTLACHASVRAGNRLTLEEMQVLLRQLEQCQQPHTCPHGRPTMVHLSASHLEREFGRR